MWPFKKKPQDNPNSGSGPLPIEHFLVLAEEEVSRQIKKDPSWYATLPYRGGMNAREAREFEIEKRAIWKRVIFDAGREKLDGLIWTTRGDGLVCPECAELEGRLFKTCQFGELEEIRQHLGCRCELIPYRK